MLVTKGTGAMFPIGLKNDHRCATGQAYCSIVEQLLPAFVLPKLLGSGEIERDASADEQRTFS